MLRIPDGLPEDDDQPFTAIITLKGWLSVLRMHGAAGHPLAVCDCSTCPKARHFVERANYNTCRLCRKHTDQPILKDTDLIHCPNCHRRRCSPTGPPCQLLPLELLTPRLPAEPTEQDPGLWLSLANGPGTPPADRVAQALDHILAPPPYPNTEQDAVATSDDLHLARVFYTHSWSQSVQAAISPEDLRTDPVHTLLLAAATGDTDTTIGLAALSKDRQPTVGRLHRDPLWTGLSPSLPSLRHLQVLIIESQTMAQHPAFALAMPQLDTIGHWQPQDQFPPGMPRLLQNLALHHGAHSCQWVPHTSKELHQ